MTHIKRCSGPKVIWITGECGGDRREATTVAALDAQIKPPRLARICGPNDTGIGLTAINFAVQARD
ncbi:MAG: hypothetical protein NDJ19_00760 [Ramlibacter sp.]|nr:hypothetical protein [Ramlibacter sp.]